MWRFRIIRSFDEGIDLCQQIFESAEKKYVFLNPILLNSWYDTYTPLRRLEPIFIEGELTDGNRMVFPLVVWHRNWKHAFVRALIPIGYSDYDYHNPIFLHQPDLNGLNAYWEELIAFIKKNVRYDVISIDGITDKMLSKSDSWQHNEICPQLDLSDIPDEVVLLKFFKTSLRGDLRRQMRRLSEIGELTLQEHHNFEDIPESTFNEFMRQHSLRWPKAYKAPHFHENLLKGGLNSGCVHFSVLKAGTHEVAWHLGFEDENRYYYYMPAGNQKYLKHSPTKVHLFCLVCRAIERGIPFFDHLRGEENYKDGWSNGSQYVNSLSIKSEKLSSRLKLFLANTLQKIKK